MITIIAYKGENLHIGNKFFGKWGKPKTEDELEEINLVLEDLMRSGVVSLNLCKYVDTLTAITKYFEHKPKYLIFSEPGRVDKIINIAVNYRGERVKDVVCEEMCKFKTPG
jgi:hypothetical protein